MEIFCDVDGECLDSEKVSSSAHTSGGGCRTADDDEERKMEKEGKDGIVGTDPEVGGTKLEVDMEQAKKAKHMIDAMTKTMFECQATVDSAKPTKRDSEFAPLGQDEIAEL